MTVDAEVEKMNLDVNQLISDLHEDREREENGNSDVDDEEQKIGENIRTVRRALSGNLDFHTADEEDDEEDEENDELDNFLSSQ